MFEALGGHGGEAAALATSVLWAGTALLFGAASRRIGPAEMNLLRLAMATVLLFVTLLATGVEWSLPGAQMGFFVASGVVGLAMGDAAYFRALRILGPRRAALTMSFAPALTAVLMVPFLGETIGWVGITGMAVTLGGILWVHGEKDDAREIEGSAAEGLAMGLLGALGQAAGIVLAKAGLGAAPAGAWLATAGGLPERMAEDGAVLTGAEVTPLYGTFLRMAAGFAAFLGMQAVGWGGPRLREAFRDRKFLALTLGGAMAGPYAGVWLSLVAVSLTNTAVAATIMATSPIFVIPLVRVVHGRGASGRAWIGAAVALAGVAMLSFRMQIRGL